MAPQYEAWEKEYRNSKLLTKEDKPQSDVVRALKYLKKEEKINFDGLNTIDLGCGTGRNSNYLAELGCNVTGLEISDTALKIARENLTKRGLRIEYLKHDIGSALPFPNENFNIALDIVSSNSLNEKEREIFLSEVSRILKSDGYFIVRALCKDGDKNAQNLLKMSPTGEKDTYYMKELNLRERVFSREDFVEMYSKYFKILKLDKKTSYPICSGRLYKRNYWIAILKK
jgi:SAM-dependent methyltransferase